MIETILNKDIELIIKYSFKNKENLVNLENIQEKRRNPKLLSFMTSGIVY